MSELKPCPFCGSEAFEDIWENKFGVFEGSIACDCGARSEDLEEDMPLNEAKAIIIEKWNTRTSPEVGEKSPEELLKSITGLSSEYEINVIFRKVMAKQRQIIQSQQAEIEQWKANHADVVARNRILSQREDLPVDRLPAHKELERSQARVKELEGVIADLESDMEKIFNHTCNYGKNLGHHLYQCRKIAGTALYGIDEPAPEGE
ncbi:hypothetical protein WH95_18360 [Kiloniella litopenaei]|uniref:Restriction alleviation protein, Lar family n=1 Tax=Kiloniella litopenaei TaxID=1549748 RepID=A0A0M2R5Y9_9PROT|nr:Lar family restriction alleviation protein [Kiloniella litopenaei]KKJ75410.1 hypothetical protein WH95_18360 [Kiloniella litopenaei]